MLCIAHRGARGDAPENTLSAIQLAIAQGADWIEIDVRCVDGHLLVIHDARLERTTNGQGRIYGNNLDTLRQLDAGNGESIPLLQEVIEFIDRRMTINIELKDSTSAAAIVPVLESYIARGWDYRHFLVSSFFHQDLRTIKHTNPKIRIGALMAAVPLELAAFAEQLGAWSVNLCNESLTQAIIDDAHRRGLRVLVFTVNHPDDIRQLRTMGVDGIFTDYPARVQPPSRSRPTSRHATEPLTHPFD